MNKGELIAHMGILMQDRRTARVVADTPCDLLTIDEEDLFSLLQVRPELCKQLFKEMASKIDELNRQVSAVV